MIREIEEILKRVGRYQVEMMGKKKTVEFKGEGSRNPVTEVDKRSEEMIRSFLEERFKGCGFIMEEGGSVGEEKDYVFCIDPLDGTVNYAHGYPMFCISVALLKKGEPILGAVYEPLRDEFFWAEKGEGAFLNGEKIRVSEESSLRKSLLATGFPYELHGRKKNNTDVFSRLTFETQGVRRGGAAALDLCYVACGRLDGFWEMGLKPWDVAAGSLMVEEAGGRVTDFSGRPFSVFKDHILATNAKIHQVLLDVLREEGYEDPNHNP